MIIDASSKLGMLRFDYMSALYMFRLRTAWHIGTNPCAEIATAYPTMQCVLGRTSK